MARRVLREPLVHFLALGCAIFLLFAALDDPPPPPDGVRIVVSEEQARRLAASFAATWRRPPSVAELDGLIESYVREEIYVREALALGLDRDDSVVRQRLRQKMEFLTESGADAVAPTEAELRVHYEAHGERFAREPRVAFEQVYFGEQAAAADVAAAREALAGGAAPEAFGRPSLLPSALDLAPAVAIDNTFGHGFFTGLAELKVGAWEGPIESSLGTHLVRITAAEPARRPPFAAVREAVERDWRAQTAERLRRERFAAFSARYQVTRPDAAAVLAP